MALQGTIDTFDLTEVIRMLAGGGKTGRLGLSGDRGSGSLWFADGQLVGSETDSSDLTADHVAVLFQLFRFKEGSFVFDQGAGPDAPGEAVDAEPVLEEAGRRLQEWTEIEAVVPSLQHTVDLRGDLSRSDVVIDQTRWGAVAAIAGGLTVGELGRTLELDELDVSRTVKDLVELGLVEVGGAEQPGAGPSESAATSMDAEGSTVDDDDDDDDDDHDQQDDPQGDAPAGEADNEGGFDPNWFDDADVDPAADAVVDPDATARDQLDALASGFGLTEDPFGKDSIPVDAAPAIDPVLDVDEPLEFADPEPLAGTDEDTGSFPIEVAEAAGEARSPVFAHDADAGVSAEDALPAPQPGEAAEVARQLANLSPEAARAVAAAARATTDEERDAALALVAEDGEEPLDPDLLRSFLSSVRQ